MTRNNWHKTDGGRLSAAREDVVKALEAALRWHGVPNPNPLSRKAWASMARAALKELEKARREG